MKRGIVRQLRDERGWTRQELAKKAGLKIRTIRKLESRTPPLTSHDDTVAGLAAALDKKKDEIAVWRDYVPDLDDAAAVAAGAPAPSTIALRAARDEGREWVTEPIMRLRYEMLRPRMLYRINSAPGLCFEQRFAMQGKIHDHRPMPTIVARMLGLEAPICSQFLLIRRVKGADILYASVYSTTLLMTNRLLDAADRKETVTLVVRVVVKEPKDDFKGFFFFQKKGEKPQPNKWTFVIDQILDDEVSVDYEPLEKIAAVSPKNKKPSDKADVASKEPSTTRARAGKG